MSRSIAVSLSVATAEASLAVAWRLYLPEGWAGDVEHRARAGVPEDVVFQTKPRIYLACVQLLAAQIRYLTSLVALDHEAVKLCLDGDRLDSGAGLVVGQNSLARLVPLCRQTRHRHVVRRQLMLWSHLWIQSESLGAMRLIATFALVVGALALSLCPALAGPLVPGATFKVGSAEWRGQAI